MKQPIPEEITLRAKSMGHVIEQDDDTPESLHWLRTVAAGSYYDILPMPLPISGITKMLDLLELEEAGRPPAKIDEILDSLNDEDRNLVCGWIEKNV